MKEYLTILLFSFAGLSASGQEVWTLDRALAHAEKNSLQIIQARYDTKRAEIDLAAIRQQRIPSLSFGSNLSSSTGRTIDPTTNDFTTESNYNQSANLNTGVQLFNGGLIHKQVQNARIGERQAELQVEATTENVLLTVVQQFFQGLFYHFLVGNIYLLRHKQSLYKCFSRNGQMETNDKAYFIG